MKLFKRICTCIMTFLIAISTIPFSTSCKNIENKNMENASLISNEMGGGGIPSIDEPDKAYPQPEPVKTDVIIPDEDKISWLDEYLDSLVIEPNIVPSTSEDYRNLPEGYTQIECLQSTGKQWIDTGVSLSTGNTLAIEIDMSIEEYISAGYNVITGINSNMQWGYMASLFAHMGNRDSNVTQMQFGIRYLITGEANNLNSSYLIDGINQNLSRQTTSTSTFHLFNSNGGNYRSALKLYSAKYFINNELVRDFIPCYDSSYDFGLYDLVNDVFYTNQGSGSFNEKTYRVEGSGSVENPYLISSAYDLLYFVNLQKNNLSSNTLGGKYFKLTSDIILNDGYFEDDGTYHDGGDGKLYEWDRALLLDRGSNLDGNGFEIKGCYTNNGSVIIQEFGYSNGRIPNEVKNISVSNFYMKSSGALFCLPAAITTRNVAIKKGKMISTLNSSNYMAGISTLTTNAYNCKNYATLESTTGKMRVSGLFRQVNKEMIDCENHGRIISGQLTGGLAYSVSYAKNCKNYGNLSNSSYNGGIAVSGTYFIDCENYGTAYGGIFGEGRDATVINCKSYGNAPLVGRSIGGLIIKNCYTEAHVINWFYQTSGKVTIENLTIDFSKTIRGGRIFFDNAYNNNSVNLDITVKDCTIILGLNNNVKLFSSAVLSPTRVKFKNILIECEEDFEPWNDSLISGYQSTIPDEYDGVIVKGQKYYGSDFSAFFVKWKTGYIGLKTLESAGVYMFAIPDEEYLKQIGYVKMG